MSRAEHPQGTNPLFDSLRKAQQNEGDKAKLHMERDAYLESLKDLYRNFNAWLAPGVKDGLVVIRMTEKRIDEELLDGPYTAPALSISFPSTKRVVEVEPMGTFMIGAWGRVDLRSGARDSLLIRAKKDGDLKWLIKDSPVYARGPATFHQLTEDRFLNLIRTLIF